MAQFLMNSAYKINCVRANTVICQSDRCIKSNMGMDYRRSGFTNIDNQRCWWAAAMMNLVVTPFSSDFKKNGAGFGEEGFWEGFTPYTTDHMLIMSTLRCKLLACVWFCRGRWGSKTNQTPPIGGWRGVECPPKKTLAKPCLVFLKLTMNFEHLYMWSQVWKKYPYLKD